MPERDADGVLDLLRSARRWVAALSAAPDLPGVLAATADAAAAVGFTGVTVRQVGDEFGPAAAEGAPPGVPIRDGSGQVVALLHVDGLHSGDGAGQREHELLQLLAAHAGVAVDTLRLRREAAALRHEAHHDPLTGLANRRALGARLGRPEGRGLALLFCDLDDFKRVNDRHGHQVGDLVLVEVGRRLRRAARATDVVARLGGDEFVVVAADLDEVSALRLARRLADAVSRPITGIVEDLSVTCTVGVAVGGPDVDVAELLARADRQLLYGKRHPGRGQARGRPRAR